MPCCPSISGIHPPWSQEPNLAQQLTKIVEGGLQLGYKRSDFMPLCTHPATQHLAAHDLSLMGMDRTTANGCAIFSRKHMLPYMYHSPAYSVGDIYPTSRSNAGPGRFENMGEDKVGDTKLQDILLNEAEDEEEPQGAEEEDTAEPAAKHC